MIFSKKKKNANVLLKRGGKKRKGEKKWSRGGKSYRVIKERRGIKEGQASKVEGVHV